MDNQTKAKELLESGHWWRKFGEWAFFVGALFVAVALAGFALQIHRKGLKITKDKTVTGTPATITAIVLVVLAVGVVVAGYLFFRPF